MLHLAVNNKFGYLDYLSIISAVRIADVKVWIVEEPTSPYWNIIKKNKFITFENIDPKYGIIANSTDQIGRTDIIYIGKLTDKYADEGIMDHSKMYEVDGEFETKDMCLIRIYKRELITPEYIKDSNTAIANLIKRVILERVWNVTL